jgi:hypothetical protein
MAKPIKSELESLSLSDIDETHSSFSKKRPRRHLIEDSPDPLEVTDDGRPKTRRVNPARLAIRLGPELVSEMEAYIVPGAKMPNFTVRKDFQERYSVDRRHIYDYFHSRGEHLLRCRILRKSYQFSKACELLKKTSTPI